MVLLTITQYAKQYNVSKQSVYDRIKRGTLKATIKDGVKMIDTDDLQGESISTNNDKLDSQAILVNEIKKGYKQVIKQQKQLIKRQDKQIESLQKEISDIQDRYYKVTTLMFESKQKELTSNIVDAEIVKHKKKSKKKSQRKKARNKV